MKIKNTVPLVFCLSIIFTMVLSIPMQPVNGATVLETLTEQYGVSPTVVGNIATFTGENFDVTLDLTTYQVNQKISNDVRMVDYTDENNLPVYVDYNQYVLDGKFYFETAVDSFVFDTASCNFETYDGGHVTGEPNKTIKHYAKYTQEGTGIWNDSPANNSQCTMASSDKQLIVTKSNYDGTTQTGMSYDVIYDFELTNFEWTYDVTNQDIEKDNYQFGFTFDCQGTECNSAFDLTGDGISTPLTNGQVMTKNELINPMIELEHPIDESHNLLINGGLLDFKEFQHGSTWNVQQYEDRILIDFTDTEKLPLGENLLIDPSLFAYEITTEPTKMTGGVGAVSSTFNYNVDHWNFKSSPHSRQEIPLFIFDTSSIPDGISSIDAIVFEFDNTVWSTSWNNNGVCTLYDITTLPTTTTPASVYSDVTSGNVYATVAQNHCSNPAGAQYNLQYTLSTSAETDLLSLVNGGTDWFGFGSWKSWANWSVPQVGIMDNPSLDITYTLPPPPDVPTSVSIDTQDVANELTLRWVAPSSGTTPDGYKIGRSVDGGTFNDSYVADTGSTAITYDNTGLSPDTSYAYRVWSLNGAVTSTSYASVAGTTTWNVPDQVGIVTGTGGLNPSLSWSAPSSDGVLTNYKIYRDGTLHDTISSSGTTYSDSTSVVSGTTYGYTVSGVSAVGEGSQSVSINVIAGIPPDPPTITGTSIDDPNVAPLDIIIDWSSPLYTGSAGITNYEVYRDAVLITTVGNVNTYTDTVPSGGGTFVFSLKAVSSHGTSILSATASQTTATPPPAPVSAPTLDIANPNPSPLDVTVTFAMPSSGGSAITSFEIYRSTDDITFSSVGTTTTLIFSDTVPNAGTFYYKLSAINLVGTGLQSPSSNITTPNVPDAITDLAVSVITDTTATLTWTAPNSNGSNIVDYTLYRDGVLISTSATTGFSDTGLITQTSYVYTVYARNNVGLSLISNSVTQVTDGVPDVVSFTATNTSSNQIDLTWSEPNDFNSAITSYVIERESPIGGGFTELITLGSVLSYSDVSVSPVTEYNYRILAVNGYGNSPTSTSSATTVSAPPTSLIVHDRSHTLTTALDLEWVAPVPSTGVNGYKITYETPVGNGFGTLVANTSNTNLYYNHTGLNEGQFYNYKVQALTPHGESQVSNSYAFTPHKLSDVVDDLVVTSNALLQHVLNWSTPDNLYGTLSGFMINYTTPAGDPQTIHTSDTGSATTTINISGLNPTIEYSFRIAAVTYHGVNATGNIGNGTTSSEIEVGDLDFSVQVNPNASPINYVLYNVDSSTDNVQVVFDSALNLDCSITERNTGDITNYSSISETTSGSNVYHNFTVTNAGLATGLDFDCWDTTDITVNGQYTLTQGLSSNVFGGYGNVPMFSLMSNFTNGLYGTEGEFAGIDLITLFIVIVSMLFFNRTNPALGVGGMFMFLGVAWAFELIPWTSGLLGAIAVMLVFAIGQGMKNR